MKLLYTLLFAFFISCSTEPEDSTPIIDERVVNTWTMNEFAIGDSLVELGYENCCVYNLSVVWYFSEFGEIIVDEATPYFPMGTGQVFKGDWEIIQSKISIYFQPRLEEAVVSNFYSPNTPDTITYFNDNLFNYSITDTSMILTDSELRLSFIK